MPDYNGTAQGVSDTIVGSRGNDTLRGFSGNDYLGGGRGNDVLIGGAGSDVMTGGLDSDTFQFAAGHLQQDAIDWITDFSFNQADSLSFTSSGGGQNIEILSATAAFVDNTAANGFGLANSTAGRELILEVRNSVTGATQQIVLIDSFSAANQVQWQSYLETLGFTGSINATTDTVTL